MVEGKKRQAAFEVYRATCEAKQRQRLTCDDYIEAIRKYRLMPALPVMEKALLSREAEIARFIRQELHEDGKKVPEEVERAATRPRSPLV